MESEKQCHSQADMDLNTLEGPIVADLIDLLKIFEKLMDKLTKHGVECLTLLVCDQQGLETVLVQGSPLSKAFLMENGDLKERFLEYIRHSKTTSPHISIVTPLTAKDSAKMTSDMDECPDTIESEDMRSEIENQQEFFESELHNNETDNSIFDLQMNREKAFEEGNAMEYGIYSNQNPFPQTLNPDLCSDVDIPNKDYETDDQHDIIKEEPGKNYPVGSNMEMDTNFFSVDAESRNSINDDTEGKNNTLCRSNVDLNEVTQIGHKGIRKSKKNKVLSSHLHRGENPYQCRYCTAKFATVTKRLNHEQIHSDTMEIRNGKMSKEQTHLKGLREFTCNICGKSFMKKKNLREHSYIHSRTNIYQCRYCPMKFPYARKRSHHELKCHKKMKEESQRGKKIISLANETEQTNETDVGKTNFNKETHSRGNVDLNEEKQIDPNEMRNKVEPSHLHTGDNPYQCRYCPAKFAAIHRRLIHELMHSDTSETSNDKTSKGQKSLKECEEFREDKVHKSRNFTCDICGKSFVTMKMLREHNYIHSKMNLYQCRYCPIKFPYPRKRNYHEWKYHTKMKEKIKEQMKGQESPFKFRCQHCPKEFTRKRILTSHLAHIHGEEKSYACSFCPTRLTTNYGLKEHMKMHAGIKSDRKRPNKSFLCDICGMEYKLYESFWHHVKTHNRGTERECKFICSICGKQYKTPRGLKLHFLIHAEDNPYKCSHCGRAFPSEKDMMRHEKIYHNEIKPYNCETCETSFREPHQLKRHVTSVRHLKLKLLKESS